MEDSGLYGAVNLNALDLSDKLLRRIPREHLKAENAAKCGILKLSNNPALQITEEIEKFEKLDELSASKCGNKHLPAALGSVKSLRKLCLFDNPLLKTFPEAVLTLDALRELNLGQCNLQEIPKEIIKLNQLEKLHLHGNRRLRQIPLEVFSLTKLKELNIGQCGLTGLPHEITLLKDLEKLDIFGNSQLLSIPAPVFLITSLREINVGSCGLTDVPPDITQLTNLIHLYLMENRELQKVPRSVFTVSSLTELSVACCSLAEVPDDIGDLKKLEKLYLFGNTKVQMLPEALYGLTQLRELDACNCNIKSLGSIGQLKKLTNLRLHGNQELRQLSEGIFELRELKELNIGQCGLTVIPEDISKLSKLKQLHLAENPLLEERPISALNDLLDLEELSLGSCGLQSKSDSRYKMGEGLMPLGVFNKLRKVCLGGCSSLLPSFRELSSLKELTEIDLSNCGLTALPFTTERLRELVKVELSANNMQPRGLEKLLKLEKLKELGISRCSLTDIPDLGDVATRLRKLDVHGNSIAKLSPIVLRQLECLQHLNVADCKLSEIPEEIAELKHLGVLNVSENLLTTLPKSISSLTVLEVLDVSSNRSMAELPLVITKLPRLKELNISCCHVSVLPDDFDKLSELEVLVAQNTGLEFYPEGTLSLKNLRRLDLSNKSATEFNSNAIKDLPLKLLESSLVDLLLHGNPMSKPPPEICNQGMYAIRSYLEGIIPGTQLICAETVSMLGDARAGKTSIVLSLRDCQPRTANPDECTHVIQKEHVSLQSEKIALINDFGGHDIYQTVLPVLLPPSGLGILVYDMSKSLDYQKKNVGKWIDTLLGKSPGTRLIVAGTHTDLVAADLLASYESEMKTFVKEKHDTAVQDIDGHLQKLLYIGGNGIETKRKFLEDILASLRSWEPHLVSLSCVSNSSPGQGLFALHHLICTKIKPPASLPASWCHVMKEIEHPQEKRLQEASFLSWEDVLGIFNRHSPPLGPNDTPEMTMKTILRYMVAVSQIVWLEDHPVLWNKIFHRTDHIIDILKAVLHHASPHCKQSKPIAKCWSREEAEYKSGIMSERFLRYLLRDCPSCHDESLIDVLVTLLIQFNVISIISPNEKEKKYIIPCRLISDAPRSIATPSGCDTDAVSEPFVHVQIRFSTAVLPLTLFETSLAAVLNAIHKKGKQANCWKDGLNFREENTRLFYERSSADVLDLRAEAALPLDLWRALYPLLRTVTDHVLREWKGSPPRCFVKCLGCMASPSAQIRTEDSNDTHSLSMDLEDIAPHRNACIYNRKLTCTKCDYNIPRLLAVPCNPEWLDEKDEKNAGEFLEKLRCCMPTASTSGPQLQTLKQKFRRARAFLVDELDGTAMAHIMDVLYSEFIPKEVKEIFFEVKKTRSDKARCLCDIIDNYPEEVAYKVLDLFKSDQVRRPDIVDVVQGNGRRPQCVSLSII